MQRLTFSVKRIPCIMMYNYSADYATYDDTLILVRQLLLRELNDQT